MTGATVESKMDVIALAYDHYRILRDDSNRAADYMERVIKRGGEYLDSDWWVVLPEPVHTISLGDIIASIRELNREMTERMEKAREEAIKVAAESKLQLTKSVEVTLHNLAHSQREEKKLRDKIEEDMKNLDGGYNNSSIIESLGKLPELAEDESYEYIGMDAIDGVRKPKWVVIKTPAKKKSKKEAPKVITPPKPMLKLQRRPRT